MGIIFSGKKMYYNVFLPRYVSRIVTGHNRLFIHMFGCKESTLTVHRQKMKNSKQETEKTQRRIFLCGKPEMGKTTGVHKPRETESLCWKKGGVQLEAPRQRPRDSTSSTDGYRVTHALTLTHLLLHSYRGNDLLSNLFDNHSSPYYDCPSTYILVHLLGYLQV